MTFVTLKDLIAHRSQAAIEHCEDSDAQAAVDALGDLWPEPGPDVYGEMRAEALLAIGAIRFCQAVAGSDTHEGGKDSFSESYRLFVEAGNSKADDAAVGMAQCYLRQGATTEALLLLDDVIARTDNPRAMVGASIAKAFIFTESGRLHESVGVLNAVQGMVDGLRPSVRGKFHIQRAVAFRKLGELDRAFQEYEAARYCFEIGSNVRYQAAVLNNIGNLQGDRGRFAEGRQYCDVAIGLLSGDNAFLAQAKETKAGLYLLEGNLDDALTEVTDAVRILTGDDKCWLPDILITRGKILARLRSEKAKENLLHAVREAEITGNLKAAGDAYLTLIEELALPVKERAEYYRRANSLPVDADRLRCCAAKIIGDINPPRSKQNIDNERAAIRAALVSCGGCVDKAAKMLGLSGPGLANKIDRDPALVSLRKKKRVRRTSLIRK